MAAATQKVLSHRSQIDEMLLVGTPYGNLPACHVREACIAKVSNIQLHWFLVHAVKNCSVRLLELDCLFDYYGRCHVAKMAA